MRNALRMRPERIIIGECRGPETLDMLQAMNTGHEGSLTTLHANTPRDAIARLETMIMMAGFELPLKAMRHADRQRRRPDRAGQPPAGRPAQDHAHHRNRGHGAGHGRHAGHLPVTSKEGIDENGRAYGKFVATGIRPDVHGPAGSRPACACRRAPSANA